MALGGWKRGQLGASQESPLALHTSVEMLGPLALQVPGKLGALPQPLLWERSLALGSLALPPTHWLGELRGSELLCGAAPGTASSRDVGLWS